MNCEKGDLAIIVKSTAGNDGKIVQCLEFLGMRPFLRPGGIHVKLPAWRINISVRGWNGVMLTEAPDEALRPIRDNPGEDESLQWAPVPGRNVTA